MRILFLSAFYPPYVIGGWEQLARDINLGLQARGHASYVLTSDYGVEGGAQSELGVERTLELENDLVHYRPWRFFCGRGRRLRRNLARVERAVSTFAPDVAFVHVMWDLSPRLPWLVEQLLPGRVVYYLAGDWPYAPDVHVLYWRDPARRRALRPFKAALGRWAVARVTRERQVFAPAFGHVLCVSRAVRRDLIAHMDIAPERTRVVYNGVDTERFAPSPQARSARAGEPLALLYVGSLVPHKGVHTAVEAMSILARRPGLERVSLTLVGSGHPDYRARLEALVARKGLENHVRFYGRVPRAEMPDLMRRFDVLLFPSTWSEPLARTMQEAMAAGLVVVGTTTGGSGEILIEGETGLTFAPEDAGALAAQVERLAQDAALAARLRRNARALVVRQFDIRRMFDEVEAYLEGVVSPAVGSDRWADDSG